MTVADQSGQANRWKQRSRLGLAALVLAVFFCGLPAIFATPAERILFQPRAYKAALAEQDAYRKFPLLLGQMIAAGGDVFLFGSGSRLLEVLEQSNYLAVARQVFPEDWVRAQTDGLIDQFWSYFNFETEQFRLVVDFRPVKARLTGAQAGQISGELVAGFPPCYGEEILEWSLQALRGSLERLPLCKPPAQVLPAANLLVEGVLRAGAAAMPDELDLASAARLPLALGVQQVPAAWQRGFAIYRFYRQVDGWLAPAALVLLAALALLARGSPRGPLYWMGTGLLLPGLTGLVIALLGVLWSSQVAPLVIGRLFGESLVVFHVLVEMLARVSSRFMVALAVVALAVTLAGAALIRMSRAMREKTDA